MANFPVKKILILITILALPGFLYYLLQEKGKNRYHPLAIYGSKQIAKSFHLVRGKNIPDTVYHVIKDFKLFNQNNRIVSFPADTAKITVVNFFFTRCPSFCKNMNSQMSRVVKEYEKNRLLKFLSITVDPDFDTPQLLSNYAKGYNAKSGKWDFLTGSSKEIYAIARQGFLVDALKDTLQTNNIIHSPMLILVDTKQRIRGYYDSGSKEQVDKLIDEIKLQITEELRQVKSVGF